MQKAKEKQRFFNLVLAWIMLFVSLAEASADDFTPLEYEGFVETESNVIILDSDNDSTTSINLQFGETLNKNLSFDILSDWFSLNDSLEIVGDLNLQGNLNLNQNQAQNFVFENLNTAPLSPVRGQIYYNTVDNTNYFWDGSSWQNMLGGSTGLTTMSALQIRRTTNFTLPNQDEWYNVPFDQTDVESNSAVLEHDNANTEIVHIKENGLYKITYQVDAVDDNANHRLETKVVELNSNTEVNGSFMVNYDYRAEHVPHSAIFIAYLNTNDRIVLQARRLSPNEIINETTLTVVKLETWAQGPKGDKGEKGDRGIAGTWAVIFGTEFNEASSETTSTTTSNSFQRKLRLNVSNIPAAKYRIGWNYEWQHRNTGNDYRGRVQLNDSTTLMEQRVEPKDSGSDQYSLASGFAYVTLSAGSHYFDLDYASSVNGVSTSIRRARLEFWKVEE